MKKICLLLVSIMLLVVLAVPALAAADVNLTATASATTVQTGDEVTITISASGTTPFTSLGIFIEYDAEIFEYKSRSFGEATDDATITNFDKTTGKMTATWEEAAAHTGEIIKIKLTVKGTKPGNTTIKFGDLSCQNEGTTVSIEGVAVQVSLICEHDWPAAWTKIDDAKHEKICSKCGTHDIQGHTWNDGETIDPPTCTEPGEEKFTCDDGCGATKTETIDALDHLWDSECDKVCGRDSTHTRETEHNYPDEWEKDTTSHWHECTKCGDRKDNADHTPGPEATADTAQICTVCEYVIKPAKEHVHKYGDEWVYDTDNHWHRCETKASPDCYVKDSVAPHEYSNDCDVTCNTCDYVRVAPHDFNTKLLGNVNGHYYKCAGADCDATSEIEPHIPGEEATDDTPQTCTECGFIIKKELSHVHDFGETWHTDDKDHWKSCSDPQCPEMDSYAPHEWDEGVEVAEGYMYTCAVCGYQLTQAEQMGTEPTVPETTPSGNEPTQPAAPQNPGEEEKGGIPWKWAGIAAIVLLIIGFILIIIEFIRSRKTNMHGRFSK